MPTPTQNGNQLNPLPLTPVGKGARWLLAAWQNLLINRVNALRLRKIVFLRSDGTNVLPSIEAIITSSPQGGTIATVPPFSNSGSGENGGNLWPSVLYDHTKTYSKGQWIWVQPANTAVTTGYVDATTGILTKATPGLYRAAQAVPADNIPVFPEPNADDITDKTKVFWIFFRGKSVC